jgi:TrmH family RNA methyltransferase
MEPLITSARNPLIKHIRTLHRPRRRRNAGLTLIEGPIAFAAMAAAGVVPDTVLVLDNDADTKAQCRANGWIPVKVSAEVLALASDTVQPQSPIAVIPVPRAGELRNRDTVVVVDVADPGNVGTMIRSAAAFGWDLCISGSTADPWSPKVLRAGAGSHFRVHLSSSLDPATDARSHGLETVASIVVGGDQPRRGDRPIALLIGSEAHGLPEDLKSATDRAVTIGMAEGVESLNAGVAASILMYALR